MRKLDSKKVKHSQSSRYKQVSNKWYFRVREGDLLGPYDSVYDTVKAVSGYIELLSSGVNKSDL